MAKLSLVIADTDESYARGLSGYISSNHPAAFLVSCFTKPEAFSGYMKRQSETDILLISPEFYETASGYANIKLRAVLTDGVLEHDCPGFRVIFKYSTGEKLLGEVIHMYSDQNPSELRFSNCLRNAELIGIYSPAGGTGKTTIAAALSRHCTELGMQSFYLNLESIQSTGVFFSTNSKRNLSYIFYYLKEKSSNLSFRMDGIKSAEADEGVHYFNPPESPLEYGEIDTGELERLLQGVREMGCYDYIFIDMSSVFDMKNYKIMDLCDRVILVTLQEPISLYKNKMLFNELAKLSDTDKACISDKFITVINKYKDTGGKGTDFPEDMPQPAVWIPEYTEAVLREDGRLSVESDGFRKAVNKLFRLISAGLGEMHG